MSALVAILRHAVKKMDSKALAACDGVKVVTERVPVGRKVVEVKKVSIDATYDTPWVLNDQCKGCMRCDVAFGVLHFKHHCRGCGWLVCHGCAHTRTKIEALPEPKGSRTCKTCLAGEPSPRPSDVLDTRYPFSEAAVVIAFAVEVLEKEVINEVLLKGGDTRENIENRDNRDNDSPATTV
jgi:hypothetical protein